MILNYDIDGALTEKSADISFWNHTGWEVEQTQMPRLSCETQSQLSSICKHRHPCFRISEALNTQKLEKLDEVSIISNKCYTLWENKHSFPDACKQWATETDKCDTRKPMTYFTHLYTRATLQWVLREQTKWYGFTWITFETDRDRLCTVSWLVWVCELWIRIVKKPNKYFSRFKFEFYR